MKFFKTNIPDVILIEPRVFEDERGYFFESYNQGLFRQNIESIDFMQDNEAQSVRGVLRGLHYQVQPHAQSKLVRVISGRILDIAVDIRKGSAWFGQHVAIQLDDRKKAQLFVPRGFAHGYVVLSDEATVTYKVDAIYSPDHERGIRWDDPSLKIDWRMDKGDIILSERDSMLPVLEEAEMFE